MGQGTELIVRGRILCVDSESRESECSEDSRDFVFQAVDGRRFVLSSEDEMTRMFQDPRVRERQLQLRLWVGESGQVAVTRVYAVRDGELWDIYYFCSVCNIRSASGGPCWCCQEEFEFVERPLESSDGQ